MRGGSSWDREKCSLLKSDCMQHMCVWLGKKAAKACKAMVTKKWECLLISAETKTNICIGYQ